MHAPSTPSAYHLLTEEHFRSMKREALFINTGRGPTVDETALVKALEEGWIAGAGLDVFEQEPAVNPKLTKFKARGGKLRMCHGWNATAI